jgi:hypothetical protein
MGMAPYKTLLTAFGGGALIAACLLAQPPGYRAEQRFTASIGGQIGDHGKCTIEVNVDDVAVVEVFGGQGRLLTLSGLPAEWRRMQCNQPMPANPQDFRFQGVDGRGRVSLQTDPRNNRGVAVIRIEDPKGGREGYTFDLTWRAEGGPVGGPGYPPSGPGYVPPQQGPDRGYPGYRDERRWETVVVSCDSDGRRRYCDADTRRGALLLRPRGPEECRLGATWGYDERGIWVDRGCRADFQVGR